MFLFFLIVAVLVGISVAGLAVGVIVKGKFPETHVGRNADMKKMGVTCAKNDSAYCQGRTDSGDCSGCSCAGFS
jgi:hypothetical protein